MDKDKVLITGGAGYIGSVLTDHLLQRGHNVTCLDNLMYGQKTPFNFVGNPNYEFIEGDSRNLDLVGEALKDKDTLIPLAGIVGAPGCKKHPRDAKSVNLDAIVQLNMIRGNDQKLLYPNTNSGYGTKSGEFHCTEETPLEPISEYGQDKCQAEQHLLGLHGKDAVTFRLATVFGTSPRMRTDLLVNDFVLQAMRGGIVKIFEGDAMRNYIHIRDVARVFEHAMNNYDEMKNQAFNVGLDDANLSKVQLAEKIKQHIPGLEIVQKEFEQDPDKRNYMVSNEKIRLTGFEPKFSLDDGIKELIKGYKILLSNDPFKNV